MKQVQTKEILFNRLKILNSEFEKLTSQDKEKAKNIILKIEEIIDVFNKAKYPQADKRLDLNEPELKRLKNEIDEIWINLSNKNLELRPKPDITFKIG